MRNKYKSPDTNTMIIGVTEGNARQGLKHNPEFKANTPYAYRLYKIHSMSTEDFGARNGPPFILVYGPMYRMER